MNETELDSLLKRARLPEIAKESLEAFPRRVVAGLQREDAPRPVTRRFFPRLAWAAGLAGCLLMVFLIGHWRGRTGTAAVSSRDILANSKLMHEMLAMFPNRVRAIVEDGQGVKLVLSDHDDIPAAQLLYVRLCDDKNCWSFVTFSGQEIQVAGQKVTTLSDAHGGIIVTGNQFVWSDRQEMDAESRFKIEAESLGPATM